MQIKKRIHETCTKLRLHRWIAWLLCVAMIVSMVNLALPVLAATNDTESEDAYCEHHTEHTEECGYIEAVEGQPCTHEHNEECGYTEGRSCTHEHDGECGYVEEQPCTHTHDEECGYDENSETAECSHVHDEDCGYVEGQPCTHIHDEQCGNSEETECSHEHDESCGYVEAVEGQPCQFVCVICGGGSEEVLGEETEQAEDEPVAPGDVQEKGLIAYFNFDNADDRLHDYSGMGVGASLHELVNRGDGTPDWRVSDDSIADVSEYFEERDDKSGENNSALHLNDNACLVLDAKELLKGFEYLTEMTVEMQVKLDETNASQNWLFYAAPNDDPAGWARRYLGLAFTGQELVAQRYNSGGGSAVAGREGRVASSSSINDGTWYTVRVVYKVSSMALYVNGYRVAEGSAPNKLADYFGEDKDSVIWFGHSGWTDNSNFNGYIDNIKIYNYANYDGLDIGPINEDDYIITENVVGRDDIDTTVNMFDYWIIGQTDNDYNPPLDQNTVLDSGINANHLFLFAGSDGTSLSGFPNENEVVGTWNNYYDGHAQTEPYQGIVGSLLDGNGNPNGYPQLAIDELINGTDVVMPEPLKERGMTESLDYLFDPEQPNAGKAAYPNVSGLFRLGGESDGDYEGYYYFRSNETFAELNTGQSDGAKKSIDGNHITLYKEPWMVGELGQFFPFNDGSDLFYVGDSDESDESDKLVQAHSSLRDQSTTSEPMNHYFGMTVETQFTQPKDGKLNYYEGTRNMTFDFSGDDDVWIFIDGVLVGDLGGLHNRVRITIDYATGEIIYRGALASNGIDGTELSKFNTTLYEMFEKAGRQDTVKWNVVNAVNEQGEPVEYTLFKDGTDHTLKFFYLERGNNLSNCSIRFNLHDYPVVPETPPTPPEEDDGTKDPENPENPENPGDSGDDNPVDPTPPGPSIGDDPSEPPAKQPSKKNKSKNPPTVLLSAESGPTDPPAGQPQAENGTTAPSAEQPSAQESEAKTLGVLASPNTGDSNMVGLWLTLLVFSATGLVAIHYRTRKR